MSARWPLEALHALRVREEDAAGAALAAACERERARAVERAARASVLGECRVARAAVGRVEPGASAGALAARGRRGALLRVAEQRAQDELHQAERRLALAGADVARARAAFVAAERAVELLERRRAAWEEARRRCRARAEEAAQDDRAAGGDALP
ncbi:hypothetical protein [Anaeromyxobacter oryzae]|uniref:Flagellar FliJ protein n=1 Tax=Anaeromyxobacter oryzae TaxID=2918170 RepID=A0ABN6N3F2_9BACT|nr:hypothetical protein [Anaeromyxobacter oryzae]BDG06449.1 hypothetical protein AMOR_54450 [Anaeromyxobacter oryzae]